MGDQLYLIRRLEGKFVGPHAMVLTFKDAGSVMNLYTYAFLLYTNRNWHRKIGKLRNQGVKPSV